MKKRKERIIAVIAVMTGLLFAACGGGSPLPEDENLTPVAGDFTITGDFEQEAEDVQAITVTPKDGKSPGAITVWYTGTDGTNYTKSETVPQNTGKYLVTFDVAAATGWNAASGLQAGTLTVTAPGGAPLVITSPGTKTWGDAAFDLATTGGSGDGAVTFSITAGNDVISINGSTVTILKAGSATVTASKDGDTSESLTITINKAQLAVNADDKTVTAGETAPAFTYEITGFVNGDTDTVVSGEPVFSCGYNAYNSVHDESYTITISEGTLAADNYTFSTFGSGTLTVNIPSTTKTFTFVVDDFPVIVDQGTNVFKVGSDEGIDTISLSTGETVTIELIGDGMTGFAWYLMGTIPLGSGNTVTVNADSFPASGTYELTVAFTKDAKPWLGRIAITIQ